jgi:hypothetical protein|tara:strand:+ start:1339 stop:1611 length:273 start_codon:yes stop_codon:yes gene_type:complete
LFDLCACPIALNERLEHEAVLSYCISKIGSFDHEIATKYGQHYGFFDVKGALTPAGSVLANFIVVFGEAELAKLQQMKVKEGDMALLKAA